MKQLSSVNVGYIILKVLVNKEEEKPGLEEFQVLRKRKVGKSDGGELNGRGLTQLERRRRCRGILPQDRSIVIEWSAHDS